MLAQISKSQLLTSSTVPLYMHMQGMQQEPAPEPLTLSADVSGAASGVASAYIVTLLTFGLKESGKEFIIDSFADHDHWGMWHRIDWLFNSTTHLCRIGTDSKAQNQFMQLYPYSKKYIDLAARNCLDLLHHGNIAHCFCCAHGRHRSVAFAELVAKQMRLQHPHIHVNVVHLDLGCEHEYLQTRRLCSQQTF